MDTCEHRRSGETEWNLAIGEVNYRPSCVCPERDGDSLHSEIRRATTMEEAAGTPEIAGLMSARIGKLSRFATPLWVYFHSSPVSAWKSTSCSGSDRPLGWCRPSCPDPCPGSCCVIPRPTSCLCLEGRLLPGAVAERHGAGAGARHHTQARVATAVLSAEHSIWMNQGIQGTCLLYSVSFYNTARRQLAGPFGIS